MSQIDERHELIIQWMKEAARDIKEGLEYSLDIEEKSGKNDLVTNLDKETEKTLINKIRQYFPNDSIISEEGFGDQLDELSGTVWFVDPIDGTLNFVKQQKNYAVMIAVYEDGVGVQGYIYNVMRDEMYHAIKGKGAFKNGTLLEPIKNLSLGEGLIGCNSVLVTKKSTPQTREVLDCTLGVRMNGSAGLESVEVATSSIVAYVATRLKPWDIAPGKIIVEELGGKVTSFDGDEVNLLESTPAVFANQQAHEEIVKKLAN